ncbi:hypothetical protein E2C01_066873 [Portunus trituberculatus]|uniref:Uncharacterized protein n=1 Tax=Portunus trituberculatus TaxID=210409 RepID=A0A5B7HIA9_PORTR|nr:hypothetical protein [Portunus trituberculatus]
MLATTNQRFLKRFAPSLLLFSKATDMTGRDQWRIGVTSLLAHALSLRPYKDVFWSSQENINVVFADCEVVTPDVDQPWRLWHLYSGRANVSGTVMGWAG